MYDAIIVGARCAGSPTALLLARKGYRVLLLDRSTFPSDIMSTHFLHTEGAAALRRWGLLDRMTDTGCPPITKSRLDFGIAAFDFPLPPSDGVTTAYCPRRTVLDKLLVDAAVEGGVELREGFSVQAILAENGAVTGIRGRGADGATVTELARTVIGADGKNSLVARAVDAAVYNERPAYTCGYYSYFSGIPMDGIELYFRPGRVILAFPTHDGLTCIGMEWTNAEFHEFRSDIDGNFMGTLELAPGLAERVKNGRRAERYIGTADLANFYRKPYGPGWALVGDAGYHKDPILGWGISDAFRDAELLAEALDHGWSGLRPTAEALAGYEQRRNEATMPVYEMTCSLAQLPAPTPELLQSFARQVQG
jgi:2-polyprenyl-6-methoxyphenol hydroxylase-like FAD-dependent oxidoreductase